MIFAHFIRNNYSKLLKGETVILPDFFRDMGRHGFKEAYFSQPAGQIKDYVRSNPDGSRFHVHEFEGGRRTMHLDKYDPDKNLPNLLKHLFQETWIAPAILVFLGLFILGSRD